MTAPIDHFRAVLAGDMKKFAAALGCDQDDERVRRFLSMAISVPEAKPELLDLDPRSFVTALLACAQCSLSPDPNLGQAYFVPRKGRVTFQIGYRGYMDLAERSGKVSHFSAACVRSEDQFDFEQGTQEFIRHRPTWKGDYVAAYAMAFVVAAGKYTFKVLPWAEVEAARGRSEGDKRGFSPWKSDLESMAMKTAIRRLVKFLPMCPEMQRAVSIEEMIEAELGEIIEARALTTAESLRMKMLPSSRDLALAGYNSSLPPVNAVAAPDLVPSGSRQAELGGTSSAPREPAAVSGKEDDLLDLDFDESKIPSKGSQAIKGR